MKGRGVWLLSALVMLAIPRGADAQGLTYSKGQTISPAYEGWEQNPDGSYNLVFGYLNRWMYLIIDGEEQFDRVNSGPLAGIPTQNPVFFENSHELIDRNGFERAT